MKKILCFGDSNVYGFNPQNGSRFRENERWSGILKNLCTNKYDVIEAGCNNRTCFNDNPAGLEQTGYKILPSILNTTHPDLVIFSLGTNDLQFQYKTTLKDFQQGLNNTISTIKNICPNCEIVILSPSVIKKTILNSFFATMFDKSSIELSTQIKDIYQSIAHTNNCYFIDLNSIANVCDFDGIHYTAEEHKKIAHKIFEFLTENFTNNL